MYGILGEDRSDVETLKVFIKRLANKQNLPVKMKGFGSCGNMLKEGSKVLKTFSQLGCQFFIICYDADNDRPDLRKKEVIQKIIEPSKLPESITKNICIVIPIQELEAWILADIEAVTHLFSSWKPKPLTQNIEEIENPKEYLEKLSRNAKKQLRYNHTTHNENVAQYLNLKKLEQRCPSFQVLANFIKNQQAKRI